MNKCSICQRGAAGCFRLTLADNKVKYLCPDCMWEGVSYGTIQQKKAIPKLFKKLFPKSY